MMKGAVHSRSQAGLNSLRRWLRWSALLGLVAPVTWFVLLFSRGEVPSPAFGILVRLWPTSLMLMATAGGEGTFAAYRVVGTAILTNVALYSVLGLVGFTALTFVRRCITR